MTDSKTDSNGNYITNKDLLLEIRSDLKALQLTVTNTNLHNAQEFGKRPTRAEIIAWLSGAAAVAGMFFGAAQLVG